MLIRLISLVILFITLQNSVVISVENNDFIYPKNKPSVFKKNLDKAKNPINFNNKDQFKLPKNKPIKNKEVKIETKEIINDNKTNIDKKIAVDIKKNLDEEIKKNKKISQFIFPKNKPVSYKNKIETANKSEILNSKDFEKAKQVFNLIKSKKWNSALKASNRVKDRDFRTLVKWMYLKTTGNQASFNDYQKFIEKNSDYPRIGRLQYLAEHKIYLKNNSPSAIINWFQKYPPVSGMGKIKLAEAYLEQGKINEVIPLIKDGWINAEIRKNDLGYYRAKFKKYLTVDDHIKRADYLAWETKYWDLKRMLRYLPKDERALYNARQILMSNSYGVDKSISNVPSHYKKNIGLEYDRLKWRNRRGRLQPSLQIL